MTVEQLIQKLQHFPGDTLVWVASTPTSCVELTHVVSAANVSVPFSEENPIVLLEHR